MHTAKASVYVKYIKYFPHDFEWTFVHRCHFFRLYAIILIDARRFSNDCNRRLKWTNPIYYFGQVAWISQPLQGTEQKKKKTEGKKKIFYWNRPEEIFVRNSGWRHEKIPTFKRVHTNSPFFSLSFAALFFFCGHQILLVVVLNN